MSTAPLARWALKERMEVGMMMASEVPTQSGMRTSSGTLQDAEELVEDRHRHRAAADPEHAGEQAGDGAGGEQRDHQP